MNKPILLCLLSAAFGAALSLLVQNAPPSPALAQEPGLERLPLGERRDGIFRLPKAERRSNRLDGDEEMTPEERVNVAVYENVNRAVVNINTKVVRNDNLFQLDVHGEGAGSGSLLDHAGHVLTNNHVIDSARQIEVTLYDGKSYEGRLVGKDEMTDIAVVKIENAPPESLHPVEVGDSSRLKVGQRVYAIGNPFGLERTLTTGIISSLNRTLPVGNGREIRSCIQIDAAINPGNSGGPLLNSRGKLIGMNTAIASSTGQSSGVGFAVPAETIARVVPQLINQGKVIRPDVGITRVMQTEHGLIVVTMQPGGPAEKAGLQGFRVVKQRKNKGPFVYETQTIDRSNADLIVGIDGQRVTKAGDFLAIVEAKRPGDEVVLTIVRQGKEMNVKLRLTAGE
jgi:S1-C subfamily serine protease